VALVADDIFVPPRLREFMHERALGSVGMLLHDMRRRPFPFDRIESVLDRPPGWMDCEALLGAPVRFGAPATRWIFQREAANAPLPMSSPLIEENYQQVCAGLIGDARVSDDFVGSLYAILVRSTRGYPASPEIARRLAVSDRTLHRRLAAQHLTFGAVLDQVREQRARELLKSSRLSIEQVGDMLGYAEVSSFSRAFRRWTGMSPLPYRRRSHI